MTNSSPENPQSSEPSSYSPEEVQRIRQTVRNNTAKSVTEEWIAIIVAFGTIGAILFWSLGGKKSNFNLSQSSFFSSSQSTTETTANVDLDLDSEDFVATENLGNLSITGIADGTQSGGIAASGRSAITSLERDNLNRTSNVFSSVPLMPSNPSATQAAIPQPTLEAPPVEPEVGTSPIVFSDINQQYWAYPFIAKLGEKQLISDADNFEPDELITRAGMANLISNAFKETPSIETPKEFTDVPANSNLAADINKAVAMGFMNGYSEGDFRPEQNIPRYQVLVSLATGLNLEPSGDANTILQNFSDRGELPEWSLDKVAAATEAGLAINRPGLALTSLDPNEPATRAEVAAMIYQTLAKSGTVPAIDSEYIVPTP